MEAQTEDLRDIHEASRKNFREVLTVIQCAYPVDAPKTPETIAMVIKRGTRKLSTLRGMAKTYNVPLSRLEAAAEESRKRYKSTKQEVIKS